MHYTIQPTKDEFLLSDELEDIAKAWHVQSLIDLLIDSTKGHFELEVIGYQSPRV